MSVITLTTDWGIKDYYIAIVKGKVMSFVPEISIVDITHEIEAFNILKASFVIKNSYHHFPKGTIHIVGVDNQDPSKMAMLLVELNGHYFLGSDNGIFSLIFDVPLERVFKINSFTGSSSFPVMECFVDVACGLAYGRKSEDYGVLTNDWLKLMPFKPLITNDEIKGNVIYIDNYGNVITNIKKDDFYKIKQDRNFRISFVRTSYDIVEISNSYSDVLEAERLALFNSSGYLEIALNKAKANSLLGLKINDAIKVSFKEESLF
ncbi:MAG: SAM-dependent chlorinase/fluorinase [Bacteroidota bacterium]